mgnify:CR=1 FL=1
MDEKQTWSHATSSGTMEGAKRFLNRKILIQMNPKNSKTKMCGDPQKKIKCLLVEDNA